MYHSEELNQLDPLFDSQQHCTGTDIPPETAQEQVKLPDEPVQMDEQMCDEQKRKELSKKYRKNKVTLPLVRDYKWEIEDEMIKWVCDH